jgi:hypothetical protein
MNLTLNLILLIILIIFYIYMNEIFRGYVKPDIKYRFFMVLFFSILLNPKRYFKDKYLNDGIFIFIIQTAIGVAIVFLLVPILT